MSKKARIRVKCNWCNKIIFIIPWKYKHFKKHFCDRKHFNEWKSKYCIGKNGLNWQGGKKKIKCSFCKKEFLKYENYIKKYKHHFCNKKCHNSWMSKYQINKKHPLYKREKLKCDYCKKIFYKVKYRIKNNKHKFCSQRCYKKWWSKFMVGKNHPQWKGKVTLKCDICKKLYKQFPSRLKRKNEFNYCSVECKNKGKSKFWVGEKAIAYVHGKSKEPYTIKFNNFIKEYIRERDGHKCQLCGVPQLECIRKLAVHHVDYDKSHANPKKLITLCVSCNCKVNTNRKYWEKYFKSILKEKYNKQLLLICK